MEEAPLPPDVGEALQEVLARFANEPLAVRSSGVSEDLPGASFAGQYETVLDVRGENGGPFVPAGVSRAAAATIDRLGSVVVALAPIDELRVADRIATSTFVLVFIPVRE